MQHRTPEQNAAEWAMVGAGVRTAAQNAAEWAMVGQVDLYTEDEERADLMDAYAEDCADLEAMDAFMETVAFEHLPVLEQDEYRRRAGL
jgi:hypothetical protein